MAWAILTGMFSWKLMSKLMTLMFGVTIEGVKNGTKKKKQFDVITKSIILSSLDVGVSIQFLLVKMLMS
jgi:hypothetical protein